MSVLALTRSKLLEVSLLVFQLSLADTFADILLPHVANPHRFWSTSWTSLTARSVEHSWRARLPPTRGRRRVDVKCH